MVNCSTVWTKEPLYTKQDSINQNGVNNQKANRVEFYREEKIHPKRKGRL